jgi:hypothetical protein
MMAPSNSREVDIYLSRRTRLPGFALQEPPEQDVPDEAEMLERPHTDLPHSGPTDELSELFNMPPAGSLYDSKHLGSDAAISGTQGDIEDMFSQGYLSPTASDEGVWDR